METLGFTKQARRTFHDVPYLLTVSGDSDQLSIEVEHAEDGRRWRSKFAARFIEEITQRTGNAKKFDVFVRMLLSALVQESDSVYIDVLTARDLEMLRRHANPQGPPTTSTAGQSDKRYLILTYRAEFDKVHYPLPLPLDERSEEEKLRAMVSRLQAELTEARQTIANAELKAPGAVEERAALQQQNAELNDALRAARREVEQLRAEFRARPADAAEAYKLRERCNKLQADAKAAKEEARQKDIACRQRERELKAEQQRVSKLQQQVKRLEDERRNCPPPSNPRSRPVSRAPSAERARPASRTPSAERARPASRPVSRAGSRASSVASSRERTPSPSGLVNRSNVAPRPWAYNNRTASPADKPAARRTASPSATLSPYRRQQPPIGAGRRTPSPGAQSRERTPSPSQGGAARLPVSLRDRGGVAGAAPPPARGPRQPSAGRAGSRPTSANRTGVRLSDSYERDQQRARGGEARASSRGLDESAQHKPGALFGLAANLGLGPVPQVQGAKNEASPQGALPGGDVEACDIDARLQALQSFLKQTKHIAA